MSKVFDYNGTFVSPSSPVKSLRSVKKVLMIDSSDRDMVKYNTNGDFVISLPRVYENVVSIRLMAAEFPPLISVSNSIGAYRHTYRNGSDYLTGQTAIIATDNIYYFLVELVGLNKTDECTYGANRSTYTDGFFAKIPITTTASGFIEYNDHSGQENIARYTPAIGKLDRLHIKTRLHNQQGNTGFIYWTTDGTHAGRNFIENNIGAEYSLTLEIEYLDNVFDDFSQIESRLSNRG
jgi:hypothetical protein